MKGRRLAGAMSCLLLTIACAETGEGTGERVVPLASVTPPAREESTAKVVLPRRLPDIAEGRLRAGTTYRTQRFGFDMTFRSPDLFFGVETPTMLALVSDPSDPVFSRYVAFFDLAQVATFDETLLPERELRVDPVSHIRPVPRDVERWFQGLPYFNASKSVDVEIAGHPASAMNYRVDDVPDRPAVCPPPDNCPLLVAIEDAEALHAVPEGHEGRVLVVDVSGRQMLVQTAAPAGQAAAFEGVVESLFETITLP